MAAVAMTIALGHRAYFEIRASEIRMLQACRIQENITSSAALLRKRI